MNRRTYREMQHTKGERRQKRTHAIPTQDQLTTSYRVQSTKYGPGTARPNYRRLCRLLRHNRGALGFCCGHEEPEVYRGGELFGQELGEGVGEGSAH